MDTEILIGDLSQLDNSLLLPNSFEPSNNELNSSSNLLFVDSSIENYATLVDTVSPDFDIFLLDSESDGVAQISNVLNGYSQIDSLQIVSHGQSGSLELGNTTLGVDNLSLYENRLSGWSEAITETGDILLYGCDVAQGEGITFIDALSEITGADIAASVDLTGSRDLGGDGDLEYITGDIEANLALSEDAIANWDFILHEGDDNGTHHDYVVQNDPNFQKETVLSGLQEPMDMAFLPDGQMLLIQKNGIIQKVDPNTANPTPEVYLDLSSRIAGGQEAGLISIVLDPNFETNNHFYIYYSENNSFGKADDEYRITRFTHGEDAPIANSEQVIYIKPDPVAAHHDGGGLSFGPDGKLYLTIGDHKPVERAIPDWDISQVQDLTYTYGKVLRINKDGSIPQDNPYVDGPGGNLDEIWAIGLRNPFRSGWDIEGNRFFIGDVGGNVQSTAKEEINLGQAGANYGWPNVEGISNNPAFTNPIFNYDHTATTPNGGAIIAGDVYRGNQFPSEYQGSLFIGDYVLGWIRYLQFDGAGNVIDADPSTSEVDAFNFDNSAGTVVSIKQAPDGSLYYAEIAENFSGPGAIYRITYNTDNLLPTIDSATADVTTGASPLTVNFSGSATDGDNDPLTYTWSFGDGTTATGANATYTYGSTGVYNASLQVSDGTGTVNSSPIRIQVGTGPDITNIETSLNGNLFRAGDTITVSSEATDDGELNENSYSWDIDFIHNAHTHPENDITGSSFSFEIPTGGHGFSDNTGYRFELTVTDANGLSDVEVIEISPEKVDLSFSSNVSGDITYNVDGLPRTGPFVLDQAINFEQEIGVPKVVVKDGVEYTFDSWSNGVVTSTDTQGTNDPNDDIVLFDLIVPETNENYAANYVISNTNTNQAPVAEDDTASITEGGSVEINVLENDIDSDGTLDSTTVIATDPINGTVVVDPVTGEITYTHDGTATTTDSFTYTVADDDGAVSNVATVNLSIDRPSTSNLPITDGLALHLEADNGVTTDGTDLVTGWSDQSGLGNDLTGAGDPRLVSNGFNGQPAIAFDGDGDKLENLLGLNGLPAGGEDRTIFFLAQYNSNGFGGFTYGNNATNQAFGLVVAKDGDLAIQAWGFGQDNTTNVDGTGAGWLIQGAKLEAGELTHYKDGVAIDSSSHEYNTSLDKLVIGAEIDSSPYLDMEVGAAIVYDRALTNAERQQIESYLQDKYFTGTPPENQAPVATDDNAEIVEGGSVEINVLENDSDSDGAVDATTVTVTAQPSNGAVSVDPVTGFITYTHDGTATTTDSFTYTVADDEGAVSNVATVDLNINPPAVNQAPVAEDDTAIVTEGGTFEIEVLGNDTDDGNAIDATSVVVESQPANGTITVDPTTGAITYNHDGTATTTDSFTYTVADDDGAVSNVATVNLSIDRPSTSNLPITDGLALHLEADNGVTTDGTDLVTGWSDQSGLGNDLTGAGDPRLVSNGFNGQPAIAFDGDGDKLENLLGLNGLPAGGEDRTIFFLAQYNSNGFGGFTYGNNATNQAFGLVVAKDGDLAIQAWGFGQDNTTNVDGTGAGWLIQGAKLEAGELTHYKDGVAIDSSSHEYNTSLDKLVIGAEIDSSPYLDMEVGAVIVYDRALTNAERQQIETYLKNKYSL